MTTAGVMLLLATLLLAACGGAEDGLRGSLQIDGSSTVFPISQAVAEEFHRENRAARISVALSGTGGGFEKLCRGEIQISNASRPIKEKELAACRAAGIEPLELVVAYDGLSVVVNPENDWVDCLTVEQLKALWEPGSQITRWNDLDPAWPDKRIHLYGPGTDSGTFDYFTEAIVGEDGASRSDYSASEDDNVLVQGVEGDRYALAYLGYAYYAENQERLRAVPIDGGNGCVAPSPETVRSGAYTPLSRPLYIYVDTRALRASAGAASGPGTPTTEGLLAAFLRYYLTEGAEIIPFVGYVPLPAEEYAAQLQKVEEVLRNAGTSSPPSGRWARIARLSS